MIIETRMMGLHLKIALVHDWLNQIGGAEDVLEALKRLYPASPVYTSIYARAQMPAHYQDWDIRQLWIDRLPAIHQAPPSLPAALSNCLE